MISKGVLVSSQQVRFVNQSASLTFKPTFSYAPQTDVICFTIDSNGIVINNKVVVKLADKLPNYVDLELSKSVTKPGQNVTLKVSTLKYSTVSIFGQDVASKLLRSGNNFKKTDVITDLLENYHPPNYDWYWRSQDVKNFEFINIFAIKRTIVYPKPLTTTKKPTTGNPSPSWQEGGPSTPSSGPSTPSWGPSTPSEGPRVPSWGPSEASSPPQAMPSWQEGPMSPSSGPSTPSSGPSQPPSGNSAPVPPPTIRRNFFEVIDVSDVEAVKGKKIGRNKLDPLNAEAIAFVSVPDSITTFDFSAVSMNDLYGLGLSDKVTSLKVFQDFFMVFTVPYRCKRTEIATLNIAVFSYLPRNQSVTISVARNDRDFSVVKPEFDGWINATDRYWQTFQSIPSKAKNFQIVIRANVLGTMKMKVDAIGTVASDSLEKPIKVIPEGIPKSITQSVLIVKNDSLSTYSSSLKCILPPTAVSDTTSSFASVVGDLLGPMISGLENLIQMSYGCGEQNLINFVPSVVALRYLEATGQLTSALKANAISFAEAGYQLQLTYRRNDNSFSAFGQSDSSGSTWLTAFSVFAFELASPYITIDPTVLETAYAYFISKQNADGSFREDGRVIHQDMQGGSSNGLPLTAFVSIVLSRNLAKFPQFTSARNKALNYIAQNVDKTNVYALCISTLALHLGNHQDFALLYADMLASGIETADQLEWKKPVAVSPDPKPWWYDYQQNSVDIEMTSYALQVLADKDIVKAIKVAKNLASRKNSYGGYGSTQDTVQALFSLSIFGVKFNAAAGTINIRLTPDLGSVINTEVNKDNLLVVQEFTLNSMARQIDVFSGTNSTGNAIVSLNCKFYEVSAELSPRFTIRTNLIRPCKNLLQQEVCISYIPKYEDVESNMVLVKMTLPSGYVYDEGSKLPAIIRLLEKADSGTTINAYFDSFTATETCFVIQSIQQCVVENLKDSTIEVTDYYSPEKKSQILYNIPSNLPDCKDLPSENESTTTRSPSDYWDTGPMTPSSEPSWGPSAPLPEEPSWEPSAPSPEQPLEPSWGPSAPLIEEPSWEPSAGPPAPSPDEPSAPRWEPSAPSAQ